MREFTFKSKNSYRVFVLSLITLVMVQMVAALAFAPVTANAQSQGANVANPYGVNTFLEKEVEDWKKERTFQLIQGAGIGWIKQHFPWEEIEFKKGYFVDDKFKKPSWQKFDQIVDLAVKYKVNIVARLDRTPAWAQGPNGNPQQPPAKYQDYADFVKAFVQHYKGKINYIQVWNEPNLGSEWNGTVNAAQYTDLLKQAYTAAKSVDPNIKIMTAPLAMNIEKGPTNLNELDYLTNMYTAGAKPYFDVISANGYGLEFTPEDAPNASKLNFRRVELLHDIAVKNGDTAKQVWFNEYGWNASPASIPADKLIWRRVTEQQQADYTVRGIKYARDNYPWAGVMFVWYFRQVGDITPDRSDYYFQMVTPEFTTKPVYDAVKKDALAFLAQKGLPTPAPTGLATAPTTTTAAAGAGSPGATTAASTTTAAVASTTAGGTTTAGAATTTARATTTASATAAVTPTASGTSNSSNDSSAGMIIVIVGAVIVLVGGGGAGYYFLQSRRNRP